MRAQVWKDRLELYMGELHGMSSDCPEKAAIALNRVTAETLCCAWTCLHVHPGCTLLLGGLKASTMACLSLHALSSGVCSTLSS